MQTDSKIILSSSPHVRDRATTQLLMLDVIVALMPTLFASILIFGVSGLSPIVTCVVCCVAFEAIYQRLMKRPVMVGDLSAVITGLLLGFNMPPALPAYISMFASFVAIIVVKQLFGGIGQNFVNPAITGRIIALFCFGLPMTTWLLPSISADNLSLNFGADLVAGATPLAVMAGDATGSAGTLMTKLAGDAALGLPSLFDLGLGLRGGCVGETCALTLLIGGLYLIHRKVITYHIPLAYLGGVFVLSFLFGVDPFYHLLTGGVMIGAFFMATDYVTSPVTSEGKLIFGLGCAFITMIIRVFGSLPEGASYSIIIMNIIAPHIQNLSIHKPFGGAHR